MAKRFDLGAYTYAHRGLWSPTGPSENSLEAFMAAAGKGLGIEFDVRPSRDGIPLIFHDQLLGRMTECEERFEDLDAAELLGMPLRRGGEINSLETLLQAWPSDAPLLCEIKVDGRTDPKSFGGRVAQMFGSYQKPAAVMSFSKNVVAALPDSLQKGQLIDRSSHIGQQKFQEMVQRSTLSHCDYIACHVTDADHIMTSLPICTWTVTDIETSVHVAPFVDAQIFEGFEPSLVKPCVRITSA